MNPYQDTRRGLPSVIQVGAVGAMVGATGAAAYNIRRVKRDEITKEDAIRETIRASLTTGAATMVAKLAGDALSRNPVLSLLAMFAAGTATAYLLQPEPLTRQLEHHE